MWNPRFLLGFWVLVESTLAQNELPYNPTRILRPSNASYAYVLRPVGGSSKQSSLAILDFSKPILTSGSGLTTKSENLPFLNDDTLTPYTAFVDGTGNITAIAGDCAKSSDGIQVWQYSGARWSEHKITKRPTDTGNVLAGANFLANGVSFSNFAQNDNTDTNFYLFGGMCPLTNGSSVDSWTSSASYSNLMLNFLPSSSELTTTGYEISLALSKGPPIAEAGFSMTPLSPTFSAPVPGQPQTQQQNFVLLGGHTHSAFINMSQVALWSLPQQGWTFVPVSQPSSTKAGLSIREDPSDIEPRSGHSAVLSDDGRSIYVIGGWVGNVGTPATPQIAKLSIGTGYGGDGAWSWSIPPLSTAQPFGTGIYGHGAIMLPGGVIMISGGYSSGASQKSKRTYQANTQIFLYNTSTNSWIDTYNPPVNLTPETSSGPLSSKSQQAGLGVGLGLGCAFVAGLFAFYLWYTKRLKRARRNRERQLLTQSSDISFNTTDRQLLENGGVAGQNDAPALGRFWQAWDNRGYSNASSWRPKISGPTNPMQAVAGSTGLFVDAPSPTRGLRKNVAPRSFHYQPAPRWDDPGSTSRRSGIIHPIAELENEDGVETQTAAQNDETLSDAERKLRELERVLGSPEPDPFVDHGSEFHPLRSHPVSPNESSPFGVSLNRSLDNPPTIQRKPVPTALFNDAESSQWLSMGHDLDVQHDSSGRVSPLRPEERTSSTLSEQSQYSFLSSRAMSATSGTLLEAAIARSSATRGETYFQDGRISPVSSGRSPVRTRERSSTNGSSHQVVANNSGSSDSDSFTTASTNFIKLQNEGKSLLGGRPKVDRDGPYQRAVAAQGSSSGPDVNGAQDDEFPFTRPRQRSGWMGSLRRALNVVAGERSFSLTGGKDTYPEHNQTATSSPIKEKAEPHMSQGPRRTVSDGGALLRHKRGQSDWDDDQGYAAYRDDPDHDDWGQPEKSHGGLQAEEEWDVEGAVSKRDVQVMFSVPKARLRVVNADMDRVSLRSASDGALSRSGSFRHREEYSRAEHDGPSLYTTLEEPSGDEIYDRRKAK